jgi:hypothetical protein
VSTPKFFGERPSPGAATIDAPRSMNMLHAPGRATLLCPRKRAPSRDREKMLLRTFLACGLSPFL